MIIAVTIIILTIIVCVTILTYKFMDKVTTGHVNYYNLNELVCKVEYLIDMVEKSKEEK